MFFICLSVVESIFEITTQFFFSRKVNVIESSGFNSKLFCWLLKPRALISKPIGYLGSKEKITLSSESVIGKHSFFSSQETNLAFRSSALFRLPFVNLMQVLGISLPFRSVTTNLILVYIILNVFV